MKNFTITYLWRGQKRTTVFPARSKEWAALLGPLQLMAGSYVISVEEATA